MCQSRWSSEIYTLRLHLHCTGCNNSIFLVVPDGYANGCCRILVVSAYLHKLSTQCVYLVTTSSFKLRGRKRTTIAYTNNRLQRFFVPSVQSCFMPRHLRHMIYQLNYGIEYLELGKVMWHQQKVSTPIARVPRTCVVRH